MNEEILSTFNGASDSSLGCLKKWDGDLASDVITKVSDIQKSVGQAAFMNSPTISTILKLAAVFVQQLKLYDLAGKMICCHIHLSSGGGLSTPLLMVTSMIKQHHSVGHFGTLVTIF